LLAFNYIWLIWLFGIPIYYSLLFEVIRYRKVIVKRTFSAINPKRMIFQITTIGHMEIVQESIDNINRTCKDVGYQNYKVVVVSEVNESFSDAVTITVPENYSTLCQAKYKARALQYAIEQREKRGENRDDIWIYHLDDESMVTKQGILSILDHIDNNREPIAEG
jgi:hypothetical protein